MVSGLLRLYDATKDRTYLTMAGLTASWLFGNNAAHQIMYDSSTGICYDGIRDSSTINKNSGAESTIEALWTLAELAPFPQTRVYLDAVKMDEQTDRSREYALFETPQHTEVSVVLDFAKGKLRVLEGNENIRFHRKK